MADYPWQNLEPASMAMGSVYTNSFFEVPKNQREYRWDERGQLTRFWNDLVACVEEDLDTQAGSVLGHFLGTIVVIGERQSTARERLQIVDGQQRLTTTTLLARVLLERVDVEHPDPGKRQLLTSKLLPCILDHVAGRTEPRICLNQANDFYHRSVVELATADDRESYWGSVDIDHPKARRVIVDALRFLDEQAFSYLGEAGAVGTEVRLRRLENLVSALCDLLYVMRIRVGDSRMAYRLFETLNERGMRLNQADLVRNVLLESADRLGREAFDSAYESWQTAIDEIDAQEILTPPELIQYSFSSRIESVKAESLFDVISTQLRGQHIAPVDLAESLSIDATLWNQLLQGNQSYWPAVAQESLSFVTTVSGIWKKHCVPLLLRIADRFDAEGTAAKLAKALWALECYLFREGTICKTSINELESVLGQASRILGDDNNPEGAFVELLKQNSPDAPFVESFKTASAKGKLAFYIAWRMEKYVLSGGGFDIGALSPARQSYQQHLEHVMPRKPGADWGGIQDREDFDIYLHRLGNHLVLEGAVNSALRNAGFDHKISNDGDQDHDYTRQRLAMPREVVARRHEWSPHGVWDFESIVLRQNYLAENYAPHVWKIEW